MEVEGENKEGPECLETTWKDVHLALELAWSGTLGVPERKEWTKEATLGKFAPGANKAGAQDAKASTSPDKSQKTATKEGKDGKRSKNKESTSSVYSSETSYASSYSSDEANRSEARVIDLDAQCAYYGAERLAASFVVTHGIVMAIQGELTLPLFHIVPSGFSSWC